MGLNYNSQDVILVLQLRLIGLFPKILLLSLSLKYQYYFFRTHEGAEIDLLLIQGGVPKIAIEIKYTSVPKLPKGYLNAIHDLKTDQNYIITPGSENFHLNENVEVIRLVDFIKRFK